MEETAQITDPYVLGYREGLHAGFEQGATARRGPGPSRGRVVAAWFSLGAGLFGAAAILMTSHRRGIATGTTILVSSAILTSFLSSLELLSGPKA